jgi:hypothetical protein
MTRRRANFATMDQYCYGSYANETKYVTAPAAGTAVANTTTTTSTTAAAATSEGFSMDKATKEAKKMSKEDIFLLCIAFTLPPAAVFGKKDKNLSNVTLY